MTWYWTQKAERDGLGTAHAAVESEVLDQLGSHYLCSHGYATEGDPSAETAVLSSPSSEGRIRRRRRVKPQ